jgi:hypothetical protein
VSGRRRGERGRRRRAGTDLSAAFVELLEEEAEATMRSSLSLSISIRKEVTRSLWTLMASSLSSLSLRVLSNYGE